MRFLSKIMCFGLLSLVLGCSRQESEIVPQFDPLEQQPGGTMTAKRFSDRTYVATGAAIDSNLQLDFWTGFSLFRDPWVIAPSSTKDRDGLGPLFNTRSCISCHKSGGRGPAPLVGVSKPSALVIRLGVKDDAPSKRVLFETKTYQSYGEQIQPRAISITHAKIPKALQGEAELSLEYDEVAGRYPDGTTYSLRKPTYKLVYMAHGEIESDIGISPRFAPIIYGAGLLDAISDDELLKLEDPNDTNQDGISARYNRVLDVKTGRQDSLGRFGLKAKHPSLIQQVAAAFRDDIGITNNFFPAESCSVVQRQCEIAASLGGHSDVEIPDKLLDLVVKVNLFMAVPPARNLSSKKAQAGRKIFYQAGCQNCHRPSFKTSSDYPVAPLANQRIWPYTDLALHDMGLALADGVTENGASGQEWRTPPLWGLGAQKAFRKDPLYLHDGRARSVEEAILWHGGEAKISQQYFINLNLSQRSELLTFLDAI